MQPALLTTPDAYRAAADLLDREGWARLIMIVPPPDPHAGAMCLGAAISVASGQPLHASNEDLYGPFIDYLVAEQGFSRAYTATAAAGYSTSLAEIQRWNDRFCRSKEDAVGALREAAEWAEAQQKEEQE